MHRKKPTFAIIIPAYIFLFLVACSQNADVAKKTLGGSFEYQSICVADTARLAAEGSEDSSLVAFQPPSIFRLVYGTSRSNLWVKNVANDCSFEFHGSGSKIGVELVRTDGSLLDREESPYHTTINRLVDDAFKGCEDRPISTSVSDKIGYRLAKVRSEAPTMEPRHPCADQVPNRYVELEMTVNGLKYYAFIIDNRAFVWEA